MSSIAHQLTQSDDLISFSAITLMTIINVPGSEKQGAETQGVGARSTGEFKNLKPISEII